MINYTIDPTFFPINQLFNQIPLGDWFYQPYYYFQNQFDHTFQKIESHLDESSNAQIEVKHQQSIEILQIPTILIEQTSEQIQNKKNQFKPRIEDANYNSKSQKQDRNLNSIVIRNFVNFINGHPNLLKTVQNIIQKRNLKISSHHYKDLFRNKFPPRQSYVGVGKLKNFIEIGKQHREVRIITLILLRKFISTDFFTVLLNSRKVSKIAKQKQLKHGKKFWKDFSLQYL